MSGRGVHRSVYSSLLDHPDFQALTPQARHVFLTVRLSKQAGPASIFVCYREVVAQQTGLTLKRVEGAFRELEKGGWVRLEGRVVWIVNGLRYDPTMRLADPKHRISVLRALAELPRTEIIASYCQYYNLEAPSMTKFSLALRIPIPIPNTEEVHPLSRSATAGGLDGHAKPPDPAPGLLDFLNRKAGKHFRPVATTLALIRARLASGATVEQIRAVIAVKVREWRNRPDMEVYLRPVTLFRASNFESYLGQLPATAFTTEEVPS